MNPPPSRRYPRTLRRASPQELLFQPEHLVRRKWTPDSAAFLLLVGFGVAIFIGTILLTLPFASTEGDWTSPFVALFVATSAVCVTGLTPVETATYWSGFGQAVILLLVQFGGLGFMTSATLLFLLLGWRLGLRERLFLSEALDVGRTGGVVRILRRAIAFTVIAETLGFLVLFLRFLPGESLSTAAWHGLFHSVSAFNNAGFDLFGHGTSLAEHDDAMTLFAIGSLAFLGGIGYLVLADVLRRGHPSLALDTNLVLRTLAGVIVAGMVLFLVIEWNGALAGRSTPDKLLQSTFQVVAARTSGFFVLSPGSFAEETLFIFMALMFIGGASGSTAGGIKLGTLGILVAAAWAAAAGRENVESAGREIRRVDVNRALAVALLSVVFVFMTTLVLARLEPAPFLNLMFEATSAFGTTGLSTGITAGLRDESLVVITVAMFVGRLGPLTLALALIERGRPTRRQLPEEHVRIG